MMVILQTKNLLKKIIEFKPDFIINAAAYTNVEKAEKIKMKHLINADSVLNLSTYQKNMIVLLYTFQQIMFLMEIKLNVMK